MNVIERVTTARGELVLRTDGAHFEVISNGTFLMDTRDGRSERLLVTAALAAHPDPRSLLIGGLGVGFSLAAAIEDERLDRITVVEIEAVLVDWYQRALGGCALREPRVRIEVADIADHIGSYDVICLDVDNGPDWTVTDANESLYDDAGTKRLSAMLTTDGVLSVWSARAVPSYEEMLRRHFGVVRVLTVDVRRGQPDVVYVAAGSTLSA